MQAHACREVNWDESLYLPSCSIALMKMIVLVIIVVYVVVLPYKLIYLV